MEIYMLIVISGLLFVVSVAALLFSCLAWRKFVHLMTFLECVKLQLDGRLRQLLELNRLAAEGVGRAAEHADQLMREHQARMVEAEERRARE